MTTDTNAYLERMLHALDEARAFRASLPEHEWCSVSVRAIYIVRTGSPGREVHLPEFAYSILETIDQMVEDRELPGDLTGGPEWAELLLDIAGLEPGDAAREMRRARNCIKQVAAAIDELSKGSPSLEFGPAWAALKTAREKVPYDLGDTSDLMLQALGEAVSIVSLKARRRKSDIWRSLDLIGITRKGLKLPRKPASGAAGPLPGASCTAGG